MSKDRSLVHNVNVIDNRRIVYTGRDKSGISVMNLRKEFDLTRTYLCRKIRDSTSISALYKQVISKIHATIKTNKELQDKCFYSMRLFYATENIMRINT